MNKWRKNFLIGSSVSFAILLTLNIVHAINLLPVEEDPLVRLPGTQPSNGITVDAPTQCFNCHSDYDSLVEPGFNWQGSMMSQSARDFVFWAAMTVAGQDSAFATGIPNAVDICERCHFPQGWLGGRSDPPNASAMTGSDFDGVHCDFCHKAYDPFFEDTFSGVREGNDFVFYWDETNLSDTPSNEAASLTYQEDNSLAAAISLFNDSSFFTNNKPPAGYSENSNGQYFISPNGGKRASFSDAVPNHSFFYSRYHKSKYFCGMCHDVSNPVLANLGADSSQPLPTEINSAYSYFHVERTFSEFMLSDYGLQGGAQGKGPFSPEVFNTSLPNNSISKCQDCHMPDSVGTGCNKTSGVLRPDESIEHPGSGQPVHDLTGGNIWVPTVLASAVEGSPNYDPVNDSLLNQGTSVLTLNLSAGEGLNPIALLAGADRARQQLQSAASIIDLQYSRISGLLNFKVQNNTGHKLISGFPEGRRMFVNIKVFSDEALIQEINPYDQLAGTLKGLSYNYQTDPLASLPRPLALSAIEQYIDELVYEMHPSSSLTGEQETFHFVLADNRYKDNRIPPKGFRIVEAAERLSIPRWHGEDAPNYFSPEEYAGGYDDVELQIATNADRIEINLFYQTTSREYIEFLRDEINANQNNITLPSEAYIIQTDAFFNQLKKWGDTIWELWAHNMNSDGAAPYLMTQYDYIDTSPAIDIEKLTNGQDSDTEPGQFILVGEAVNWTYEVFNTGNVTLTSITVIDDQGVEVNCPQNTLQEYESMTCTASGTAVSGQYTNTATVTATPPVGPDVSDSDMSHYFGISPAIDIEKSTNGQDSDTAPGPYILVGEPVNWTYEVFNTGNVTLTSITVTDDQGVEVGCPRSVLQSGESMTCIAGDVAYSGQYTNTATVTATPPVGPDVSDTDMSHYFGISPAIDIEKLTNGQDSDTEPGQFILVGWLVTWTYEVTNTGNATLTGITVDDDQGMEVGCPSSVLQSGESMTCIAGDIAYSGQYTNTATATGTPPVGPDVTDTDMSHYFGVSPSIDIEKSTNGLDSDTEPGQFILVGEPVNWTYEVFNTGNVTLTGITIIDDMGVEVSCPANILQSSESMTCSASGAAVSGQYTNTATATGTPPGGPDVSDSDMSHYFGVPRGDINADKQVDIQDAILVLKITNNIETGIQISINEETDVNADGKIGLEEAINALQVTSGMKP